MRKYIVYSLIAFLLFSCENKKRREVVLPADTVAVAIVDTFRVEFEDTLVEIESNEPEEEPVQKEEDFDDFVYRFAFDEKFQLKRVVFPLPYYDEDSPLKIEKSEWKHDSLFFDQNCYTLFFDNEEELDMLADLSSTSIQLEWVYMETLKAVRYYFERINGRWMLEAVNQHTVNDEKKDRFIDFFVHFSTDSVFQLRHISDPLQFVTTDPDDDFAILESVLDPNQWLAFKPELSQEKLSNISYGQKNEDTSPTKIVQVKGIGNGFLNTLFFRKKHGKWILYKFEDTSN